MTGGRREAGAVRCREGDGRRERSDEERAGGKRERTDAGREMGSGRRQMRRGQQGGGTGQMTGGQMRGGRRQMTGGRWEAGVEDNGRESLGRGSAAGDWQISSLRHGDVRFGRYVVNLRNSPIA